jgi:hypothetical protein
MDEGNTDLLSRLRDIHAASEPGWWPPAPGWWVLALLTAVLLALALRYGYRRWQVVRRRGKLLFALEKISREVDPVRDPHEYLARMNILFRVVALRAFPGTQCARLQGLDWVRFVQSLMPEGAAAANLSALASGPYEPCPKFDAGSLRQLAQTWVRKYG